MNMTQFRINTLTIFLFFGLAAFSSAGISAGTGKVIADPGSNATWTGEGGMDNFIGTCAPCHGDGGKGDGMLADALGEGVKARDLTDAKYFSAKTDEELFKVVKFGGASVKLSAAMPPQKDTFTDAEIKQIIQYMRNSICKCKYKGK